MPMRLEPSTGVSTRQSPIPEQARVFGFKEIYSPWVRKPTRLGELFDGGIGFVRGLFPRAKFIFHWRENLTRIAASDFWRTERERDLSIRRFEAVVRRYEEYVDNHPDHAFATSLEGVTVRKKQQSQLRNLFKFLGEELTPKVKTVAREHLFLHDWTEELHTRRVAVRLANGSVIHKNVAYAWATSSQAVSGGASPHRSPSPPPSTGDTSSSSEGGSNFGVIAGAAGGGGAAVVIVLLVGCFCPRNGKRSAHPAGVTVSAASAKGSVAQSEPTPITVM